MGWSYGIEVGTVKKVTSPLSFYNTQERGDDSFELAQIDNAGRKLLLVNKCKFSQLARPP
jgi:hypothetical protein